MMGRVTVMGAGSDNIPLQMVMALRIRLIANSPPISIQTGE
jgi:hypothetical protein